MLDVFKVRASAGEYSVQIGIGQASAQSLAFAQHIVLCDAMFATAFREQNTRVLDIAAHESFKNLDQMAGVVARLRDLGANRKTRLLAVGGGVIQDIATFVASIYMRGIPWDYMPTTLLGMVDSCIGGKSSINVGSYKNLVGNYHPPQRILVDLKFAESLNAQQRASGLFEAVKICFASGGGAFDEYLRLAPSVQSDLQTLQDVVSLSLQTKRWFIEIDEFDRKERLLLNFGHTFAHAIEGAGQFGMPHGIAVGVGMLAALAFSCDHAQLKDLSPRALKLQSYCKNLVSTISDMPVWARQVANDTLMDHFESDKKHTSSHYVLIVPDHNGQLQRLELERSDAARLRIQNALVTTLSGLQSCPATPIPNCS